MFCSFFVSLYIGFIKFLVRKVVIKRKKKFLMRKVVIHKVPGEDKMLIRKFLVEEVLVKVLVNKVLVRTVLANKVLVKVLLTPLAGQIIIIIALRL